MGAYNGDMFFTNPADYDRLLACVNVCKGVPTNELSQKREQPEDPLYSPDPFRDTIFEQYFSLDEGHFPEIRLSECKTIVDAECQVIGYIHKDAAKIVLGLLNGDHP